MRAAAVVVGQFLLAAMTGDKFDCKVKAKGEQGVERGRDMSGWPGHLHDCLTFYGGKARGEGSSTFTYMILSKHISGVRKGEKGSRYRDQPFCLRNDADQVVCVSKEHEYITMVRRCQLNG